MHHHSQHEDLAAGRTSDSDLDLRARLLVLSVVATASPRRTASVKQIAVQPVGIIWNGGAVAAAAYNINVQHTAYSIHSIQLVTYSY
jgi:hypothetical protein